RDDSDDDEDQRIIVQHSKTQNKKIVSEGKISASFNVYINDNFDGGILEFANKDYVIKPEVGMLVNIPLYKEFMHRVTKVTNGNRHTIYGRCWDSPNSKYFSTNEDC
ncbi:MAG: 2OG-Fe(II) oxygenase, partial [Alphaproteobacteria bacterium]|nr:2OG-Fe(II) oxygenase [Alphaproteobacteria bacterium]